MWGWSVVEYWLQYFGNRRFPKNQEFHVVYTSNDHSVPYQPESALYYWLVNLDFIPTSVRLPGATSREFFDEMRHAYVDIARCRRTMLKRIGRRVWPSGKSPR